CRYNPLSPYGIGCVDTNGTGERGVLVGQTLSFLSAWPTLAAIPQPSEDTVRKQLDEVLSRPEFSGHHGPTWLSWVVEWIAGFFRWLGSLQDAAPILFWLLLIGCVALLALLLLHIIWTVRRVFFAGARSPSRE